MSGTVDKSIRPLYEAARRAGWRERALKNGVLLYPPDGTSPIPLHGSTHSRGPHVAELRKRLREAGVEDV